MASERDLASLAMLDTRRVRATRSCRTASSRLPGEYASAPGARTLYAKCSRSTGLMSGDPHSNQHGDLLQAKYRATTLARTPGRGCLAWPLVCSMRSQTPCCARTRRSRRGATGCAACSHEECPSHHRSASRGGSQAAWPACTADWEGRDAHMTMAPRGPFFVLLYMCVSPASHRRCIRSRSTTLVWTVPWS